MSYNNSDEIVIIKDKYISHFQMSDFIENNIEQCMNFVIREIYERFIEVGNVRNRFFIRGVFFIKKNSNQ
jgi:hypothetical protein